MSRPLYLEGNPQASYLLILRPKYCFLTFFTFDYMSALSMEVNLLKTGKPSDSIISDCV